MNKSRTAIVEKIAAELEREKSGRTPLLQCVLGVENSENGCLKLPLSLFKLAVSRMRAQLLEICDRGSASMFAIRVFGACRWGRVL